MLFSVLLFVGCANPTTGNDDPFFMGPCEYIFIEFTIGYEGRNMLQSQDFKGIVNTFDEWTIIRGTNLDFYQFDEKYNKLFFVDNSLIVYAFERGWRPVQTEVEFIVLNGIELTVCLIKHEGDMAAMWNGLLIIEVTKKDIAGVTNLLIESN